MKGWNIFLHSLNMVLRNWKEALQIGLLPVAIIAAAVVVLLMTGILAEPTDQNMPFNFPSGGGFLSVFLTTLLACFCILWVVVNWHSFVLKEEYPQGWVPPLPTKRIFGYLLQSIVVSLCLLPVSIVLVMFIVPIVNTVDATTLLVVLTLIYLPVYMIAYRLFITLPATAIGEQLSISEAWTATKGSSGTLLVLSIVMSLASVLINQIETVLNNAMQGSAFLITAPLYAIWGLVGVSVLTTLYGHYVQGRPLD